MISIRADWSGVRPIERTSDREPDPPDPPPLVPSPISPSAQWPHSGWILSMPTLYTTQRQHCERASEPIEDRSHVSPRSLSLTDCDRIRGGKKREREGEERGKD